MILLLRMELLKLVKRPMTWILLILLLGGIGFGDLVGFLQINRVSADVRASILGNLTLPGTLTRATEFIYFFGTIMLSILAASAIGSEYSWGTLRPMLATGVPRLRFLGAKLVALAIVAVAFDVLPLVMNAILAVPVGLIANVPVFTGPFDAAWVGTLLALAARTYLMLLVAITIAFLISLLARSQAAGIGAALGLLIGEQIVGQLLRRLDLTWATTLVNIFPNRNSQSLLAYNVFGRVDRTGEVLGQAHSLVTLAVYCLVCVVVALAVFRRRDVGGAA
ncbi:MAG TPA: ABC transporter permease subunit [Thermomicrobiales bacterium]|nr:ABC transporter permease subunit [Thermomicrobiales bacterium]